jgi:hypothetical protein
MNSEEIFIVFTSKYSNSCKQIEPRLQFITPHFNTKFIDVDNPIIRKSILEASTNQIKSVPAIMLFMPQRNTIKIYEGMGVLDILTQAEQMVQAKLQQQQQELEEQQRQQQQQSVEHFYEDEVPVEESVLRRRSTRTIQNSEGKPVSSLDSILDEEADEEDVSKPRSSRKKIQKGVYADPNFAPTDENGMISSLKPLPPKGLGHDKMARSSIQEFNINDEEHSSQEREPMGPDFEKPKTKKSVSINNIKTVHIIDDDIDPVESDDKPKGMSIQDILGENGAQNIPTESKETSIKSAKVKNAAEALMNERKNML